LQGRGWIERRAVNGDARSHALFLRADGSRALARSKKLAGRHEQHLTKLLGAKRWQSLMGLMRSFG
jgi:DNA-binding MarR family transcriptional regulator